MQRCATRGWGLLCFRTTACLQTLIDCINIRQGTVLSLVVSCTLKIVYPTTYLQTLIDTLSF